MLEAFYLIFLAEPPEQEEKVFNTIINSLLHTIVLTVNEVAVRFDDFPHVSSYVIIGGVTLIKINIYDLERKKMLILKLKK